MEIQIKGLSEIINAFEKAQVGLPVVLHNAMANSVTKVRSTAQEIVPVRTGMLKKSIVDDVSDRPLQGIISVGQPYGEYVEFGTWKMRAQPYMRPAASESLEYILDQFRRAITTVINMIRK
jgi:HK97 gp10 family phage protein